MNDKHIIIADINTHKSYKDFYSGEHKYTDNSLDYIIDELIKHSDNNLKISKVLDFEDLTELLNKNQDKQNIIFSNFPADNTYTRFKVDSKNGMNSYFPSGYSITFDNYKKILERFDNITLYIVTGASEESFSNNEVKALSKVGNITIKRKRNWPSFNIDNYIEYIKNTI